MTDSEIVELLATKVMGWTDSDKDVWKDQSTNIIYWKLTTRNESAGLWAWNPLINPTDSKMVREKLAGRFITATLKRMRVAGKTVFVYELFHTDGETNTAVCSPQMGDTEERAVALCALKSVGVEV